MKQTYSEIAIYHVQNDHEQHLVPYACARGVQQTLYWDDDVSKHVRRTINGELVHSRPQHHGHRKFSTCITCEDVYSAATDGLWPGQILILDCAVHLICAVNSQMLNIELDRTPVRNSVYLRNGHNANDEIYFPHSIDEKKSKLGEKN